MENSDAIFYLFIAYTFIWALIFWYTLRLGKRETRLAEELDLLKKSLKDKI